MKTQFFSLVLAAGAWASGSSLTCAQPLNPNDLPAAAQQALNSASGNAAISSVQQTTRDGQSLYEVRTADGRTFYVTPEGQLSNPVPAAPAPTVVAGAVPPPTAVPPVVDSSTGRSGRQLSFDQLPPAVQNAVRAQVGTTPIGSVGQVNVDGQTAYIVTYNRDGQPVHLRLDPTGRVLSGDALPAVVAPARVALADGAKIAFNLLPQAVRNAIHQYSLGAPVLDVTKGSVQGQPIYQVAFHHLGKMVELQIAENGSLIRDALNEQYLASVGMLPSAGGSGQQPSLVDLRDWRTAPMRQPLLNPTPIALQSLPEPVRSALLTYASGGAIGSIQRGTNGGRAVYEAQLHPNGQRVDLRLTDAGALVNDQVNDRYLADLATPTSRVVDVGRAATTESVSASGSSAGLPNLSNVTPLAYTDLPVAVRTTVTSRAGEAPIDVVQKGTLNGKTVYDVSYNRGGHTTNLRVADDGSVLNTTTTSP